MYVCVYVVCTRAYAYAYVRACTRSRLDHVWSLCLYSTMHMHQLSYDKSTDFVSIFFLSVFFFSSPLPSPSHLPTYLPSTHSHSLRLSVSLPLPLFSAFSFSRFSV